MFLTLPRISGTSVVGRSLQRGRVMSISATQRMPYCVEPVPDRVPRLAPAVELGQPAVEEAVVLDVLQERHHLRVGPDHVRDVQERQAHLRGDVVRDGQRQRVGHVLLAQPLLQVLVQPPRGLHRAHEHLMAAGIDEEPLQLLDVLEDEVEQRRSGLRADLAPQFGERGLGLRDELGDDGRIGLERGRRGAGRRTRGRLVGEQRDEAAVDDGLQRVTHQRLLPPDHGQEGAADGGRRQALRDVDEQPPAGLVHARERDQLVHGEPSGFMGSVIICW